MEFFINTLHYIWTCNSLWFSFLLLVFYFGQSFFQSPFSLQKAHTPLLGLDFDLHLFSLHLLSEQPITTNASIVARPEPFNFPFLRSSWLYNATIASLKVTSVFPQSRVVWRNSNSQGNDLTTLTSNVCLQKSLPNSLTFLKYIFSEKRFSDVAFDQGMVCTFELVRFITKLRPNPKKSVLAKDDF